jgi:succinate dehydrogenase / fumarate reductase, cytochrome b subunit
MGTSVPLYKTSVGQKLLTAFTGLFLCSFLIVHLVGNIQLFKSDNGAAFNAYSRFMSTNPAIRAMELGLLAGFLGHILLGLITWWHNRTSRPVKYELVRASENSDLTSRIMFISGSIVFVFLVIHLINFFVPTRFGGEEDMYQAVKTAFSNPIYVVLYLIALCLLGFHLRHGFESAFQTLGLRPRWQQLLEVIAIIFWLLVPVGFATMPIYFMWLKSTGGQ